jgi:PAS domain S-box-containing protein
MEALDQAAPAVAVLDPAGRILQSTPRLARLAGRSAESLAGLGLGGIAHPDDWARLAPRLAEVARAERAGLRVELRCLRPDGTTTGLALTLSPLQGGAEPRAIAIVEERGAREPGHALEAGDRRFEVFMRHLPGLAWIKDQDGRYVFANDAAERAFQRTRDELYGRRDDEIFPAHTGAEFRENDRKVLRSGAAFETIETLEHADGVHHSLVSKFPISVEGAPDMVGGIAIDITERIAAEAALRESDARFRDMADHAPVLIWSNGARGCEFVNREYLRFVGCSLEEVQGDGWRRFLHPEDAGAYLDAYARAVAARRPFDAQFRFRRADGEYRWLHSTGVPRFHSADHPVGYVGCSADITEIKRSEQALREADRRKDEFLATLAHELRSPLAPIRSALERLRGDAGRDPATLRMLERQVDQIVHLVDDLLDVSRITRGHISLRREPVALADVVRTAVETARPLLEAAGHELTVSLPPESRWLDADPLRLSQILVNLLSNAAKYTQPGGHVELAAEARGAELAVTVRDDGIGIAADVLPRVFEPFTQLDPDSGASHDGLGIGLALAAKLAELHGGRLEARSEGPGRGSEFCVTLPCVRAAPPRGLPARARSRPRPDARALRDPILVVDDNRDGAESLALLLRSRGLRAEFALDGASALQAARLLQPAVVLLDLGMPEMDGFEVARRMRAEPSLAGLTLVAVTGWNEPRIRERCAQAGFDHHVVKPVKLETLESLVARPRQTGAL